MELDKALLDDFAEITYDKKEKLQDVTCYGTAIVQDGNEYVRLDAADSLTPATFAVRAHHNDRVMVMIKNHRATVIANITTPSMTLGILNVTDGIIVQGYLTTNEARTAYDDQTKYGLTFSSGGIGAYGGAGKYWYVTNAGDLYASSATIVGNITATSGYLGSSSSGFTIDEWGIYSGTDRSSTTNGAIALANSNFTRVINDTGRTNLRFAIGSNFGVAEDGTLYTTNADLSGKITATSGKIGKWNIGSISSTGQLDGSLYSGNFGSDGSIYLIPGGTTSSLSIAGRAGTDWVITSGSNFGVTKNGVLYTNGATVIGDVTATTLTATASGTIGPWSLNSASLYKAGGWKGTTAGSAYFGDNGISVLNKFYVDATGKLTATEVDISGAINATSGTIGSGTNKITIGTNSVNASIYYGMTSVSDTQHDGFYIGTDGIALGKGAFKVTNTGSFTATTGKIGPWDVNSTSIYRNSSTHGAANGLYFGTSGLSITDKFQVNSVGKLTATGADISGTIKAYDGEIGGWKIGQAAIYRGTNATATSFDTEGSLYFGSLGLSLSDKFSVTAAGALTATGADISGTIKADLGKIGGWTISTYTISKITANVTTQNSYRYQVYLNAPETPDPTVNNAFALQRNRYNGSAYEGWNNVFAVRYDGYLMAKYGKIGNWNIGFSTNQLNGSLYSGTFGADESIYLIPGGVTTSLTIAGRSGTDWVITAYNKFGVTKSGALYATGATVSGTITATTLTATQAGTIGPWKIDSTAIYKGTAASYATADVLYFGNKGLSLTNKFSVSNAGELTAISGSIAGWKIDSNSIYYGIKESGTADSDVTLMSSSTFKRAISGITRSDLKFAIGGYFGVTKQGRIYTGTNINIGGQDNITGELVGVDFERSNGIKGGIYSFYTTRSGGKAGMLITTNKNLPSSFHGTDVNSILSLTWGTSTNEMTFYSNFIYTNSPISIEASSSALYRNNNVLTEFNLYNSEKSICLRVNAAGTSGEGANGGLYSKSNDGWIIRSSPSGVIYLGGTSVDATTAVYKIERSGTTVTYTRLNGGTGTFTVKPSDIGALATSGGTLTNSINVNSDGANDRYVGAKNSLGNVALYVNAAGNHGLYSTTKGGWIIYCNKDANSTNSMATIPRPLTISGNVYASTSSAVNISVSAQNDKAGAAVRANSDGNAAGLRGIKTAGTAHDIWICYMDSSGTPKLGSSSDRRDKNVYGLIDDGKALNVLRDVELVNFSYKSDPFETIQNGVVAQQIRDVLIANDVGYRSYMCIESTDDGSIYYDLTTPEEKVHYSIDYSKFTPLLWKGWQIHDNEIETLKQQINELKAEISALKGAA